MSKLLIILVGLIYVAIGVSSLYRGNVGLAITFIGYAFSNIGLYMVA